MENALLCAAAGNAPSLPQYAARLRERLLAAQRTARENLDVARMEQAEQYNKGHRHLVYNIGDLVLSRTHLLSIAVRGFTAAFAHKWQRPYRITAQTTLLTYEMQSLESGELVGPVHVSDLKAYHVRTGDDEQVVVESECGSPASNDRTAGDRVGTHRYDLRVR